MAHRSFMDYVQDHERDWGNETYDNRPGLAAILTSPVVVFWKPNPDDIHNEKRLKITLHNDTEDLERILTRLMFITRQEPPDERIYAVFQDQQRIMVAHVSITFRPASD